MIEGEKAIGTTIRVPDEVSPGAPPLTLGCSHGWARVGVPDTLLALTKPQALGEMLLGTASILFRYYERGSDVTPATIASEIVAIAPEVENFAMREPRTAELGGHPAFVLDVSFDVSRIGTLVQRNLIAMTPKAEGARVFHVTVTANAADPVRIMSEAELILASATIENWNESK